MTPPEAGGLPALDVSADIDSVGICGLQPGGLTDAVIVAEDLLDLVTALLEAAERQPERGDAVPYRVVDVIAGDGHEQGPLVRLGTQAPPGEFLAQRAGTLLHLDEEHLARPGEAVHRVGPQQPARIDRHEAVADPLRSEE